MAVVDIGDDGQVFDPMQVHVVLEVLAADLPVSARLQKRSPNLPTLKRKFKFPSPKLLQPSPASLHTVKQATRYMHACMHACMHA